MINASAVAAIADLFDALGLDTSNQHLRDTPERIAKFYTTFLAQGGETFRFTTFDSDEPGMVITGRLRFYSMCAHHFVPFFGDAYVAYLPNGKLAGLSKLARTLEMFAHRPQVQEQLTREVANYIQDKLDARGIGVYTQAEHLCMSMRGVEMPGHQTTFEVLLGEMQRPHHTTKFRDHIKILQGGK